MYMEYFCLPRYALVRLNYKARSPLPPQPRNVIRDYLYVLLGKVHSLAPHSLAASLRNLTAPNAKPL